jgi:hypothetical protein
VTIPTDFSVTRVRKSPIANPEVSTDAPVTLGAEQEVNISSPSSLDSLNAIGINTPITKQSQSAVSIPLPVAKTAESALTTPTPVVKSAEDEADTPTPVARDAENAINTPVPTSLSANARTPVAGPFPLNHARILYENLLSNYSSLTVSNGSNGEYALTPNTWQRWSVNSSSTETIILILPNNLLMDTFCVGAHNLFGTDASQATPYKFSYSSAEDGTFVNIAPFATPTSNDAIMVHIDTPVSVKKIRFEFSPSPIRDKSIGYISGGLALQMQRPFFNGHVPITDGDATEYYSNRSESGEIIGQQIRRLGFETSAEWRNIDDAWYRANFVQFKEMAKTRPFFFAWNLLEYPNDVGFCRISQDINSPMQNGFGTKRSISMNLLGAG